MRVNIPVAWIYKCCVWNRIFFFFLKQDLGWIWQLRYYVFFVLKVDVGNLENRGLQPHRRHVFMYAIAMHPGDWFGFKKADYLIRSSSSQMNMLCVSMPNSWTAFGTLTLSDLGEQVVIFSLLSRIPCFSEMPSGSRDLAASSCCQFRSAQRQQRGSLLLNNPGLFIFYWSVSRCWSSSGHNVNMCFSMGIVKNTMKQATGRGEGLDWARGLFFPLCVCVCVCMYLNLELKEVLDLYILKSSACGAAAWARRDNPGPMWCEKRNSSLSAGKLKEN